MPITGKTLYVADRNEWRAWLAENYDKEKEVWLIKAYEKKLKIFPVLQRVQMV